MGSARQTALGVLRGATACFVFPVALGLLIGGFLYLTYQNGQATPAALHSIAATAVICSQAGIEHEASIWAAPTTAELNTVRRGCQAALHTQQVAAATKGAQ